MSGAENINRKNYCDGMRDAIPIALGYLAVAFTLGIAARNAGVYALPATIMSLTNTTSAGICSDHSDCRWRRVCRACTDAARHKPKIYADVVCTDTEA